MSDLDDYVLEPFTVWAMSVFRDANDPSRGEGYRNELSEKLVQTIEGLDDLTRGIVIIDLLTLVNSMEQVVSIMQVQSIEEAQKK